MTIEVLAHKADWAITNDSVMGGVSAGSFHEEGNTMTFSGVLSTENSGGFTSVFKQSPELSADIKRINIVIKGDGKTYQLRVRTLVMGYELAYKINLDTIADTVTRHTFELSDFDAVFRGRLVDSAPKLKATTITHVGLLLSAKQSSHFSLTVYSIAFLSP